MTELLITWSDGAGPRPSDLLPTASIQRAEIAKGGARPIETESLDAAIELATVHPQLKRGVRRPPRG